MIYPFVPACNPASQERYERKQQIEKDKAAIAEIDHIIKMQVDGNMAKLHSHLDMSRTLKSTATKSIAAETQKLSNVNDEALLLLRKVRNANTKLTSQLASITQQNTKVREFSICCRACVLQSDYELQGLQR